MIWFLLAVLPAFVLPGFFEASNQPKVFLAAALAPGLFFIAVRTDGQRLLTLVRPEVWAGAFLLWGGVSSFLGRSPWTSFWGQPDYSLGWLALACQVAVLLGGGEASGTPSDRARTLTACVFSAVLVASYGLAQAAGLDPLSWQADPTGRPSSTLGHPNFLAEYLAISLPLTLCLLRRSLRQPDRVLAIGVGFGALGVALGILLAQSRAGWLAAAAGLLPLGMWTWRETKGERRRPAIVALLAVAAALVFGLGALGGFGGAMSRLDNFWAPSGRFDLWRAAWVVGWQQPWTGQGLDTFALIFGQARSPDYWRTLPWDWGPGHAHNQLFQIFVTTGLPGVFLAIGLVLSALRVARRAWFESPAERDWLLACLGGLLAHSVASSFGPSMLSSRVVVAALLASICGLAYPTAKTTNAVPLGLSLAAAALVAGAGFARVSWAGAAVVVASGLGLRWLLLRKAPSEPIGRRSWTEPALVLLAAAALVVGPARASVEAARARRLESRDPQAAAEWWSEAARHGANQPAYWPRAALSHLRAAAMSTALQISQEAAIDAAGHAVALAPTDAWSRLALARAVGLEVRSGKAEPARLRLELENALRSDPNNAALHVACANAALENGDESLAMELAAQAASRFEGLAPVHLLHGIVSAQRGEPTAEAAFRAALVSYWPWKEAQGRSSAHLGLARLLIRQGRAPEAWPEVTEALRLTPESEEARKLLVVLGAPPRPRPPRQQ